MTADKTKIAEILSRGVEEIFVMESLEKRLLSGKQLRIKLGIDPTSPHIHLGRAVILRKLKAFQDLGHKIVLIIGDFTAKIGDPSDKLEKRPTLTEENIKKNLETYLDQIGKIINLSNVEVRYNSEWLKSMDFLKISELLECFTVQQMSKRRNFKDRLDKGEDIFLIEFLYPAMQGYDSVMVEADVELGGFDQLFNLMAGRTIQKKYGYTEQDIITMTMLEGTDGRKMSSSWGNIISLTDSPEDMFGKTMSLRDDLIIKYFLLTTDIGIDEIDKLEKGLKNEDMNPFDVKKLLAYEITKIYHGEDKALLAQKNWGESFSEKKIPEMVEDTAVFDPDKTLAETVISSGLVESKSEWARLLDSSAIEHMEDNEIIRDLKAPGAAGTYRIGKKRFFRILPHE